MIMGPLFTVGVNVPVQMRYSSAVHMRVGMQLDLPLNCSNQYSRAQRDKHEGNHKFETCFNPAWNAHFKNDDEQSG